MKYIKVKWLHKFDDEPILIYCELDDSRMERRKVEIYSDGSFGLAFGDIEFGGTSLGLEATPSIEEIMEDEQFDPCSIDMQEFESVWGKYNNYLNVQ